MKKTIISVATLILIAVVSRGTCYAQGSLTPPGVPAPTMKSLNQIEPRTPISSLPYVITNSGSYYVTTNLLGGVQDGILILTNNVTLDLRGFTLLGSINFVSGIHISNSCTNVTICNGKLFGWSANGVYSESSDSRNLLVEHLNVTGSGTGIALIGSGTVRDCEVNQGSSGIFCKDGGIISNCNVREVYQTGIYAQTNCAVSNCRVEKCGQYGIVVTSNSVVTGCFSTKNASSGIHVDGGSGNTILGNVCTGNNTNLDPSTAAGISLGGWLNRVDGNQVNANNIAGIKTIGNSFVTNNVIVRNFVTGNGANNYVTPYPQIIGPIVSGAGTITNSNPWANFSY